jgi:hypothetical protein
MYDADYSWIKHRTTLYFIKDPYRVERSIEATAYSS